MAQLSANNACGDGSGDPCRPQFYPLFNTGISNRQVPICDGPYCECETPAMARLRITREGTLDRSHWIEGWVIAQLVTRGEISCEEHILKKRDGGWWADSFRPTSDFKSGSKLWSLQWAMVTNEALIMAKQYATQAIQYLLAWGVASTLKVDTKYVSRKVMRLSVTVIGPGVNTNVINIDGQAMPNAGWLWQEYKAGG